MCGGQPRGDALHRRDVVGDGGGVAPGPALDLAAHVAVGVAERGEAGGLDVDRVQLGEGLDGGDREAAREGRIDREARGQTAAQDDPADPLHHVEPGPEDRFVAEQQRPRDPRVDGGELAEERELAVHVVGRLDLGAEGRAAQDQLALAGTFADLDEVGEVAVAAGELLDRDGRAGHVQGLLQVRGQAREVEDLAHGPGAVDPLRVVAAHAPALL
jgi:hypothetical protein